MFDLNGILSRIEIIDQEDRALQRCNPSAWLMPEDGQEHMHSHMLLPSRSSFGFKAINLPSWCEAPIWGKNPKYGTPVRHMSVLYILCSCSSHNSQSHPDSIDYFLEKFLEKLNI